MELPIYIDGKQAGTLTVRRDGDGALVEAVLGDVGRVVRLTVYGDGAYYLGIPVPEGGGMRLTRRLGPGELRRFPAEPAYAAEARMPADAREREPSRDRGRHVLWLGGRPHYF